MLDKPEKRTPLLAKLKDTNGDELPSDTSIVIGIKSPSKHTPDEIAYTEYDIYQELSLAEQSNKENQDLLYLSFDKKGYRIYPDYEIYIQIKSTSQIDWSNSQIILPIQESRAKNRL